MKRVVFLIAICTGLLVSASAQQVSVDLQFKPRSEFRNGYASLPDTSDTPSFHVNNRARLRLKYSSPRIEVVAQPQYIYVWGQNTFNAINESAFGMHQAYAQMNLLGKTIDSTHRLDLLAFRIGRQEFNFDGGRILSNLDWAPQGIKHDAAIFLLKDGGWTVHAGAGFNQNNPTLFGTTFTSNMYKSMQLVRVNHKAKRAEGSLLFFKEDFQRFTVIDTAGTLAPDGVNSKINVGGQVIVKPVKGLSASVEYYSQLGMNAAGQDISSSLLSAALFIKPMDGKFTFSPGFDLVSGNEQGVTQDEVNRFFAPTYGINHKFYGLMDYFFVMSPFGDAGLEDYFLRTSFRYSNTLSMQLQLHYFRSAETIFDFQNQSTDPYLGTEIDWVVDYHFTPEAHIQFGACYMMASPTMQVVKGVSENSSTNGFFSYLQFQFTPKFL